ncbi:hypothetical protein L7F22_045736 [Adiantum nelumboides]|nr:hypothetical protein [Adiantum nelumboides]
MWLLSMRRLSGQSEQPTIIMLLNFEKAYDKVDWVLLEGTLSKMDFPQPCILGIFALYRSATAAVTIGGHVGQRFTLSHSVRQHCPLAPYLFLFFAKTMALYLRGRIPQLQSLHMPVSPDLLEQEYVNDTMLFYQYAPDTLDSLQSALLVFCCASGSLINWHKSSGFVVGLGDICRWVERQGFIWLDPSQKWRYLNFMWDSRFPHCSSLSQFWHPYGGNSVIGLP